MDSHGVGALGEGELEQLRQWLRAWLARLLPPTVHAAQSRQARTQEAQGGELGGTLFKAI